MCMVSFTMRWDAIHIPCRFNVAHSFRSLSLWLAESKAGASVDTGMAQQSCSFHGSWEAGPEKNAREEEGREQAVPKVTPTQRHPEYALLIS